MLDAVGLLLTADRRAAAGGIRNSQHRKKEGRKMRRIVSEVLITMPITAMCATMLWCVAGRMGMVC